MAEGDGRGDRPGAAPAQRPGGLPVPGDASLITPDASVEAANAPGWREVLTVGAVVVVVVLALAFLTSVLPASFQDVVFHTPLAIVVLLVGTIGLLYWVARRPSPRV